MHGLPSTSFARLPKSPEIFSQGDGELGRSARFLGFTRRVVLCDATRGALDRCPTVKNPRHWDLSEKAIAACIEVHRHLGPGLLESAYEAALCEELALRGIRFERQRNFPIVYKGRDLEQGYRIDLVLESQLVLELKAVDSLLPVHAAQVLTYLRLTGIETGLLVNFNAELLRFGIRRLSLTAKSSRASQTPDLPVKNLVSSKQSIRHE
jgi:GxxExxY protein